MLLRLVRAAVAGLLLSSSIASAQPSTRPMLVLVHGRGQLERGPQAVEQEWWNALQKGVKSLTSRPLVDKSDVEFVWYADALGPLADAECTMHETNPRSARMWFARQTLDTLWDSARRRLLQIAAAVPAADATLVKLLLGDVYIYLSDLPKRCTVDRRFLNALLKAASQGRPIVIVAHSLGSLIVYNYLQDHSTPSGRPPFVIPRLVTIGSMLSVDEVYQALLGSLTRPPIPIPQLIESWVNVRHGADPLAFTMTGRIGVSPRPTLVEVVIGGNIAQAHDAANYLSSTTTATAIAWAWCRSWNPTSAAPAGCADVRSDVGQ